MMSSTLLIAIITGFVFIAVSLLLNYQLNRKKQSQLKSMISGRNAEANLSSVDNDEKKRKEEANQKVDLSKKLKSARGGYEQNKDLNPKSIRYLLIQSGTNISVFMFWILSFLCAGLCYLIFTFMDSSQIAIYLWTIIGLFGIPRFILKKKVEKRQTRFLKDFADSLDAMTRLLKSGMPVSEAIAMTANEYEGPIAEEMSKVYEAQRIGDTLPEAVQKMAFRVPLPEVKMFATAITIQTQTGASLSEVLENLSNVIRDRFRLKRKVKALSSEAKISAAIIGCLPLFVIGGMYFTSPDYISLLWTESRGKFMMYGGIAWMSIGVLLMRQMINFKV